MSTETDRVSAGTVIEMSSTRPLWGNRDFLFLWSGQTISTIGTQVSQFASPLLVLLITGSPGLAGLIAGLVSFPIVIFALPAGALIDRWNRKTVMIIADVGRALALGSIAVAFLLGHLTILQLLIAGLVEGTCFTFYAIAEAACLPRVVAEAQLDRAYAMNGTATNAAYMSGPAISGWLFALRPALPFAFDALSYVVSIVSLSAMKQSFQEERVVTPISLRHLVREIGEGIRWLWQQCLLRYFLVGALVGNAVTNGLLIALIYEGTRLHLPSIATGILLTLYATGGIAGSLLVMPLGKRHFGRLLVSWQWLGALVLLSLLFIPALLIVRIGTFPVFAFVLLALASCVYFAGETCTGILTMTYRAKLVPDSLRGRVNSVYRLVAFAGPPIGLALTGLLLQLGGLLLVIFAFVPLLVVVALLYTLSPHIRQASLKEVSLSA